MKKFLICLVTVICACGIVFGCIMWYKSATKPSIKDPAQISGDVCYKSGEQMDVSNSGEQVDTPNSGEEKEQDDKPPIMDWEHDFSHIAPPINRVLGYSVRDENNYTHWYDFIGAYQEIGECSWTNIVSVRSKRMKGKPLDKWEREFYNENRKLIDLPRKLTDEEKEWLDSDW